MALWVHEFPSPPQCYSLKITNYRMRRKKDFLHLWLLQCIKLYQRRQNIASLDTIAFLDTYVCINNPY